MIEHYVEAVRRALSGVLELLTQWQLPLSIVFGSLLVAGVLVVIFGRGQDEAGPIEWRKRAWELAAYVLVGVILVIGWAGLNATRPVAQIDIRWRAAADATQNLAPDAPPVYQAGPAVAALIERPYARSVTLPPSFLNRLGSEGISVLAPYLTDPSTENVVRLRDRFRRSGRNAVFTRETVVLEEEPMAFSDSHVKVHFQRLTGRAYQAAFEGRYRFENARDKAATVHFLFDLPPDATVRDLKVSVGNQVVTQPKEAETYEWKGVLAPGEKREAVVAYNIVGARVWSYYIGSDRRRVQQFQLDADPGADVQFLRGSLQPTLQRGNRVNWQLSNVITGQKLALVFPRDDLSNRLYLQALSVLPVAFILFFVGVVAMLRGFGRTLDAVRLSGALVIFALGLGASTVLTIYAGPIAGLIAAPLGGAMLTSLLLGRRALLAAVPTALLPGAFLSAQNSGLLVLILSALTLIAFALSTRRRMAR